MGFLDSIGTVLGGFNDVKQIDSDGFDFREKRRQADLARQQQQEQWQQENTQFGNQQEDRSVNQVADVLAGAPNGQEPDVSPLLSGIDQSRRAFMLDRARGVSKERKSALARQKAESDAYLRSMTESGQDSRLGARLGVVQSEGAANRGSREGVAGADREVDWARIAAMMSRGGQSAARKPYYNVAEKRTDFLTNDEIGAAPPGMYTDVTSGRAQANSGDEGMNTIVQNLDDSLANYEQSQKGLGMLVPSSMNVAWDRYRSALQSAGQIFGRQFLKDTRVSEQDREAYAKTIGQPDRWLTVLDPKEARRRLDLIKKMAQKYPEIAGAGGQGGEGGGGGGPTPPRPPGVPEGARFDPITRRWRL